GQQDGVVGLGGQQPVVELQGDSPLRFANSLAAAGGIDVAAQDVQLVVAAVDQSLEAGQGFGVGLRPQGNLGQAQLEAGVLAAHRGQPFVNGPRLSEALLPAQHIRQQLLGLRVPGSQGDDLASLRLGRVVVAQTSVDADQQQPAIKIGLDVLEQSDGL